ncbi:hypothetical protein J7T55_007755 [Diaporthe amygdali]|uniref:uncharacterized protein n=1 Tax=Phomopsis amygdali TaxID=1214568 RepID=UPI0022FE593F|nr:uncharacterized protein J7T55_007755 [Diaporthe amygdali]KAJ0107565.1 hypothetical protein J7T55_007755 [Diaporthe amygdali]
MAETFHVFSDLPKELRLKIWEQAMIEDRPNRRILLYQGRVVPFKQFISPLLLVNQESRKCAKAFYNVKLDIYAVPPVRQDQVECLEKDKHWGQTKGFERAVDGIIRGYTDKYVVYRYEDELEVYEYERPPWSDRDFMDLEEYEEGFRVDLKRHWSLFVWRKLCVLGASSVGEVQESASSTGVFYISPEHDIFIDDYDCGVHFCIENASKILGTDFPFLQEVACRHVSAKLSAATRHRVSTLALVRLGNICDAEHCVFAEFKSFKFDLDFDKLNRYRSWAYRRDWKKKAFPRVRSYFVLRKSDLDPFSNFLAELTDSNNIRLSQCLESWESEYEGGRGKHSLYLRPKKGGPFGTEPADWVRDLMAHWQVST